MSIKKSLSIAVPVSSVWFGALVGPSMISGAFAAVYFAPYGPIGLLLPLLCMGLAATIIAFGANVTKNEKVYNYSEIANRIYGRFSKVLTPILEVYIILAMVIGGSSVASMGGTFFASLTGAPELVGAIIVALISIILVLWGAKLVRASSTIMSLVMIIGMVALSAIACINRSTELGNVLSNFRLPEGVKLAAGISGSITLAFSNSVNALTLSSVEQRVETTEDCVWIGISSFVLNSAAFIISTLMLLPYSSEIMMESVPVLAIVKRFLVEKTPWLPAVYMITMFLALLSSGAPQLNAVAYRVRKLYPEVGIFKDDLVKNLVTGIIYFALCIVISTVGLRTIISKGYGLLGYLAMPLIVIPLLILMPIRYINRKKTNRGEKNEDN